MNNSRFRKRKSIEYLLAKFNTIITSLKALDEGFLARIVLGNVKVYEEVLKKDFEMVKGKKEQSRSLSLKVKKEPPKNNDQRAFIGGAWSDNGEDEVEKTKMKLAKLKACPNEICLGVKLGTR
ncbi:hypothetical protein Tco_0038967 [Tanacetum coccineum]